MQTLTFQNVRNILSDIPNISYGGCAIAALAMSRWLRKFENVESEIIYGFKNYDIYEDNKYFIRNWNALHHNNKNETTSCTHAGIRIKNNNEILDCKIIWGKNEYDRLLHMPEDFVISSFKDGTWNKKFKRHNIKLIEEKLDIDLSDININ